jgi:hypothetical protein
MLVGAPKPALVEAVSGRVQVISCGHCSVMSSTPAFL